MSAIKLEDRVDFHITTGSSVLVVMRSKSAADEIFELWARFVSGGRMKMGYAIHADRHHISFENGAVLQVAVVVTDEDANRFQGIDYDHLFSVAAEFKNDELIARLIALTRAKHHAT